MGNSLKLYGLSIGAGLVMAIPFLYYQLGWLSLVALLPFFYLLQQLQRHELSKRSTAAYIWLSGWIMMLGVTFWIVQTQPERWAALDGWWAIGGLVLTYLIISSVLSFGFVIFGCLYVWLKLRLDQKWVFLLLPAAWVVGEWLRSWLFSLVSVGPNSTIGPHWNFGILGFAASVTPLVYGSRFIGLLGLSFLVVVINLAIWWLLHRRWKLPVIILLGIVVLSGIGWMAYSQANGKHIKVGTLQLGTNDDPNFAIGSIKYHEQLRSLAPEKSLDVLVLSEYSEIFGETTKQQDIDAATAIAVSNDTPIITSRQRHENDRSFNTVTVYRPDSSIAYEHDKQFLIPVGEAMPYLYTYLFRALGRHDAVTATQAGREVNKGKSPAEAYRLDGVMFGSMACSGAIAPELYRGLAADGAGLLTNSASLSIFSKAPTYHQQALQMARFMAVSNARPYVQATDGSISFVLDQNGNWLQKSNQKDLTLLKQEITTNLTKTPYSLFGEWVAWLSLVTVVVGLVVVSRAKSK
jgi:apolipoprotein N-acyltransferase